MKVANVAKNVSEVADKLLAKVNFNDKKYVPETTKGLVGKILVAKLFRLFVATKVGEFAEKLIGKFTRHCHLTQLSITRAFQECREAVRFNKFDDVYMVADKVDKVTGKLLDCIAADVKNLSAEVQPVIKMVAAEVAARKKTTTESTSSKVADAIEVLDDSDDSDDSDVEFIDYVVDDSDDDVVEIVEPAPTVTGPKPVKKTHKKGTKGGCKKGTHKKGTKGGCKKGTCKKGAKKRTRKKNKR